ncbi:hypothetical protein F5148DRAFT_753521 [Russula earlei]|uniref:Uncharacterized protein n=1 Tax=Russula earlei TaxID=71964 RepID=A0ACC0UD00_9AGAM|nr:hypothetical protein F5148DRAFT_753521 [Russula earlei]
MSPTHHQVLQPNASANIADKLLDALAKQLPSSKEKRGDRKLELARDLAVEYETVISQSDRDVINERITFARETKDGLHSKLGFSKFIHAREYYRVARDAYRYAKYVSERGRDTAYLPRQPNSSSVLDPFDHVIRVAQPLYRCYFSCKDAFPSSAMKEEWVAIVWSEACAKTGAYPSPLPQGGQFIDRSMKLLYDMKMKIMPYVESFYGFDASRAPEIIHRNARRAQALLTQMTFIYCEPIFGRTPRYPYCHPIIQKAINITWFQNKNADGIIFHEHFNPISIQTVALALTVIECCIDEWTDGTRMPCDWDEARFKTVYHSHISSLTVLRDQAGHNLKAEIFWRKYNAISSKMHAYTRVPHPNRSQGQEGTIGRFLIPRHKKSFLNILTGQSCPKEQP